MLVAEGLTRAPEPLANRVQILLITRAIGVPAIFYSFLLNKYEHLYLIVTTIGPFENMQIMGDSLFHIWKTPNTQGRQRVIFYGKRR